MSSSVLGLGAAAMGAAGMGTAGKQKRVSVPQPSAQDYLKSYMATMSNQKLSDKRRADAMFGGPVKSVSGNFYYGEAPKKIPEGAFIVQGQTIGLPGTNRNVGSYTTPIETYQIIRQQRTQQPAETTQTPQLRLNLAQGGRVDVLNTKDIQHAIEGGATLQQVRQTARAQNLQVAPIAQEMLRSQGQQQEPQLRLDLSQAGRVDVLNRQDIKHAVAQGASMQDVRQAARAQDLRVSAKAKSMLQKDKKNNN
jgi:hypothetical protein